MSQAPFWPVATDAMIADTTHLTAEETGAYFLLLMSLWNNEDRTLIINFKELAKVTRLTRIRFEKVWTNISYLFEVKEGKFTHIDFYVNSKHKRYISPEVRAFIFTRDDGCCVYCGDKDIEFHIDHIHPVVLGGDNSPDNLALACAPCNLSKGAKTLKEWLGG